GTTASQRVLLAGCVAGDDESVAGASDGSLKGVQDACKLAVCSSNAVPYAYRDAKDKKLKSTDIEMARAVAHHLKITNVELYVAINEERSEQISFLAPMSCPGRALVLPEGNPAHILSQEDFNGHNGFLRVRPCSNWRRPSRSRRGDQA